MVVTNSGPLIALAKLGLLDKLGLLYEKVAMPKAVYDANEKELLELLSKPIAKNCFLSMKFTLFLRQL